MEKRFVKIITYFILTCAVLMILLPLYITVITTFKTPQENALSFFKFPQSLYLGNYKGILSSPQYYRSFLNTVYITVFTLIGSAMLMPMMSYAISRSMNTSRIYKYIYFFLLIGIFIPFQVKMMPLVKLMSSFKMLSPTGLIILCIASTTCESVFLYVGYMNSIPVDIEEAACIDGASTLQTYGTVVFPLLKPIMATVLIKDGLWMWNDFMLPLLILNRTSDNWTLTLFQYNFKTEYAVDYGMSFTTLVMSMAPIIILYVFLQRYIISGLTSGAVKG